MTISLVMNVINSGNLYSVKVETEMSIEPYSCVYSVHCTGLLDIQNILSVDTVVYPGKLKVIHSVITWSVSQSVLRHRTSIVLCSVSAWLVCSNVQSACAQNIRYFSHCLLAVNPLTAASAAAATGTIIVSFYCGALHAVQRMSGVQFRLKHRKPSHASLPVRS
jgi:hypothetical protein